MNRFVRYRYPQKIFLEDVLKTNKCLLGWKWEAMAVSAGKVILLEKEHKYERLVNYCKTLFEHMGLQAFFEAVIFMSVFGH